MIKCDREIVAAIRAHLADRIGKGRCEFWFGASTRLEVCGASLLVQVPNRFFQDWLRSNFRRELETAALAASGRQLALEFRIDEALSKVPPLNDAQPTPTDDDTTRCVVAAIPSTKSVAASWTGPAKLSLPRRPLATLDSYVVGPANAVAVQVAQSAATRVGHYSPLLFFGPAGCGKTHLAEGICGEFRRRHPQSRVLSLSAEQFTGYFLEALHGSGMPSFRRKYRDLDLLAIDDLQFFTNKRATLVELLHTIDTISRAGRQLVFTADRSPADLKALGPELISRLTGGMICRIECADYDMRLKIAGAMAQQMQMQVPADVLAYIAEQFTSQARELCGALKSIHAFSLAHQQSVTLELARRALGELLDQQARVLKLADIERAVCDVLGIEVDTLQSPAKSKRVSQPRMLAMWLARKYTRAGLSEIGSYFGRRSHSTVISAQRKIDNWKSQGAAFKVVDGGMSLVETIRRVEERLRVG